MYKKMVLCNYSCIVVNWFWRKGAVQQRALSRGSQRHSSKAHRVDFAELAPNVETFLGQAAYLQLGYFETITRLIRATSDLREKNALSLAAGAALKKHQGLLNVIRDLGQDPATVMLPFQEELDHFRISTLGDQAVETMLSVHLTAGILDDFYLELASNYGETGKRVTQILEADNDRQAIAEIIHEAVMDQDEVRWLLSAWGRRLVGDTLLIARAGLRSRKLDSEAEKRVEPIFTALMGSHAKRMDAIGLAS